VVIFWCSVRDYIIAHSRSIIHIVNYIEYSSNINVCEFFFFFFNKVVSESQPLFLSYQREWEWASWLAEKRERAGEEEDKCSREGATDLEREAEQSSVRDQVWNEGKKIVCISVYCVLCYKREETQRGFYRKGKEGLQKP